MSNFKAIIFDMDGVLIDSESHWALAERPFREKYNLKITPEMIIHFNGRSEKENLTWIKNKFDLKPSVEELLLERSECIDEIYKKLANTVPGVENILIRVKQNSLPQALSSGAPMRNIDQIVNRFAWKKYFDQIVSSEHVNHIGKPNPAIFLRTAELLQIEPRDCVVIEDAQNGIAAAKSAGMTCVALVGQTWSRGDLSAADCQVKNFSDIDIYNIIGI